MQSETGTDASTASSRLRKTTIAVACIAILATIANTWATVVNNKATNLNTIATIENTEATRRNTKAGQRSRNRSKAKKRK